MGEKRSSAPDDSISEQSKRRKSYSNSADSSDSLSDSEDEKRRRERRQQKEMKKRAKKSAKNTKKDNTPEKSLSSESAYKKQRRERKRLKKQLKKINKKVKKLKEKSNNLEEENIVGPSPDPANAKRMTPMTKEEWEKQQSIVRKVVDPETGRQRLVKGDGEILEEIVSQSRHKEINKMVTKADGASFQAALQSKLSG